jgi:hypothetical protein
VGLKSLKSLNLTNVYPNNNNNNNNKKKKKNNKVKSKPLELRSRVKNHALAESLLSRVFSWDVVDVGFPTCSFVGNCIALTNFLFKMAKFESLFTFKIRKKCFRISFNILAIRGPTMHCWPASKKLPR